jgi:hypothetical protein
MGNGQRAMGDGQWVMGIDYESEQRKILIDWGANARQGFPV